MGLSVHPALVRHRERERERERKREREKLNLDVVYEPQCHFIPPATPAAMATDWQVTGPKLVHL